MDGVMEQPIPYTRFVDVSRFRIIDLECFICRMLVAFVDQIAMKRDNVGHEVTSEFLHILSLTLTADEFLPSGEKIFKGNDIIIAMTKLDPSQTMKAPPPTEFCRS